MVESGRAVLPDSNRMIPNRVVTAATTEAQPIESRPVGAKCILITTFGIAVIGVAPRDPTGYAYWAPLPTIPKERNERAEQPTAD
jgi:hypothetical protein